MRLVPLVTLLFCPALDSGNNALVPPDSADLDGNSEVAEPVPHDAAGLARRVDAPVADTGVGPAPIVDMGAYERQ